MDTISHRQSIHCLCLPLSLFHFFNCSILFAPLSLTFYPYTHNSFNVCAIHTMSSATNPHQIWDIPELLTTIGRILDPSTLTSMILVNKLFHTLFSPLLYNNLIIELDGHRQRLPSLPALKHNSVYIHHLMIVFPTNLDLLDALMCPNLVTLRCRGWRGVRLRHTMEEKEQGQVLLDRIIRTASSNLKTIEFYNLWPIRKDKIWGTIAVMVPMPLRELRLELVEEEMVGDGFWRACANTEGLVLERFMTSLSKPLAMPLDVVLDLDDDALSRAASIGNSDDEGGGRGSPLASTVKRATGTPTGTETGRGGERPYSFSRVKHLSLFGPSIIGLDDLSLIRYCHNLKSLQWDAIAPTFATDVSSNPHVTATPPVLLTQARREDYTWKNLESLQLGGDGATDINLATILQWCFRLTTLIVPGTGFRYAAMAVLENHFGTLRILDWERCEFARGAQTQMVLASCPRLENFKTNEFVIDERIDESWVCKVLGDFTAQEVVFTATVDKYGGDVEVVREVKRKVEARICGLVKVQEGHRIAFLDQLR